jgi:hypothetical protein
MSSVVPALVTQVGALAVPFFSFLLFPPHVFCSSDFSTCRTVALSLVAMQLCPIEAGGGGVRGAHQLDPTPMAGSNFLAASPLPLSRFSTTTINIFFILRTRKKVEVRVNQKGRRDAVVSLSNLAWRFKHANEKGLFFFRSVKV